MKILYLILGIPKRALVRLYFVLMKYLSKTKYLIRKLHKKIEAKRLNIKFLKPNYVYINKFNSSSVVIDVGCGFDADFSSYMIKKYELTSFGVDPTKKHKDCLEKISQRTKKRFKPVFLAVSSKNGEVLFSESEENVSGSILKDHINVKNDRTSSYKVRSVTVRELMKYLKLKRADFLKLDLEGAEYNLIEKTPSADWKKFDQIFIEFHHHCIDRYTPQDTKKMVNLIKLIGFKIFSIDDHNFLFYKNNK